MKSYQVLARKWRPRSFQDLVGQEHVLRVLMNALDRQRLHHAYLFAGTRGVGKTTLARLFAKCLNCEVNLGSAPCNSCATCRSIDAGQFMDLYEIDAASRTKVEDTRDLLENVAYPPVQGRYKVYLIDEVHMLSGHSFNALLKTLEEPPPQVMFIFATTEPKRLPITILSRCLQFHLKHIEPKQIAGHLKKICDSEQVEAEEEALVLLAEAAEGSLRDALSLLDQAIVYSEGKLTRVEINQMLGYIAQDEVLHLLEALVEQDAKQLFKVLKDLETRSPDYQQVLSELASMLHQLSLLQLVPEHKAGEALVALSKKLSAEDVQLYYQITLMGKKDLPYTPSPAQGFEMVILRLLAFHPKAQSLAVASPKPVSAQVQTKTSPLAPISPKVPAASAAASPVAQAKPEIPKGPQEAPLALNSANWREIVGKLELAGLAQALAMNCDIAQVSEVKLELLMAASYKPMLNQRLQERIELALAQYLGKKLSISFNATEEEVSSPAKQKAAEDELRRASALESLQQDPGVKKIQSLFNATLDSQSLEVGGED